MMITDNVVLGIFALLVLVALAFAWGFAKLRLDRQQRRHQQRLHELEIQAQQQLGALKAEKAIADEKMGSALQEIQQLRQNLHAREQQLDEYRASLAAQNLQLAEATTRMTEERKAAAEKLAVLSDAKESLSKQFEVLANRIFEEKSDKISRSNQQVLESAINPLKTQLREFKQKVEDVYDKESKERVSLLHEIGSLRKLNQQMSEDALNLTKALKGDNKIQGNWGEVVLERVLEESGLRKGHEYETQVRLRDSHGRARNPDVILHLPDNKDLVIDAKVSLLHYEQYCSFEEAEQKAAALKQHVASLRAHIQGLSFKEYENLEGIRTLDFVFIFIPIEGAFLSAVEADSLIFREAYEKNIVLVSPTTLLATLRTVESIWRYERQNKNAERIAQKAGALYDQFVLVLEALDDTGKHLERAQKSYDQTIKRFSQGRGNLLRKAEELEKLGAKNRKKLPDAFMEGTESAESKLSHASDEPVGAELVSLSYEADESD